MMTMKENGTQCQKTFVHEMPNITRLKSIKNLTRYRDSRSAKSIETR